MKLNFQKKLAGKVMKVSKKRVVVNDSSSEEIKDAITKADVRGLIKSGIITIKQKKGSSRVRANKIRKQKRKSNQKGPGSRKGTKNARLSKREQRINITRKQREFLKYLKEKDKISNDSFKRLYSLVKGGFFRSLRHLKLYVTDKHKD